MLCPAHMKKVDEEHDDLEQFVSVQNTVKECRDET